MSFDATDTEATVYSRRSVLCSIAIGTGAATAPAIAGVILAPGARYGHDEAAFCISEEGGIVADSNVQLTLYAPSRELLAASDEYPPEFDITLDPAILTTDNIRLQGGDEAFGTLAVNQVIAVGTGALVFDDLADITSGEHFFRCRIERGSDYGPWSQVWKHGDITAPTITSANTASATEGVVNPTGTFTASETCTFELGGADAGLVSIDAGPSATCEWTINATTDYESGKRSYVFTVTPTDLAGNEGDPFTFTYTVTNNPADDPAPSWDPFSKGPTVTLSFSNTKATNGYSAGQEQVIATVGRAQSATSSFTAQPTYENENSWVISVGFGFKYVKSSQSLYVIGGTWGCELRDHTGTTLASGPPGASTDVWTCERVGLNAVFKKNGTTVFTRTIAAGTGDLFAFAILDNLAAVTANFTGY